MYHEIEDLETLTIEVYFCKACGYTTKPFVSNETGIVSKCNCGSPFYFKQIASVTSSKKTIRHVCDLIIQNFNGVI